MINSAANQNDLGFYKFEFAGTGNDISNNLCNHIYAVTIAIGEENTYCSTTIDWTNKEINVNYILG